VTAGARRSWKDAYREGMVAGLTGRIRAVYEKEREAAPALTGRELVVLKDEAVRRTFGDFAPPEDGRVERTGDAVDRGFADAGKVNVNRVVRGQQPARELAEVKRIGGTP